MYNGSGETEHNHNYLCHFNFISCINYNIIFFYKDINWFWFDAGLDNSNIEICLFFSDNMWDT